MNEPTHTGRRGSTGADWIISREPIDIALRRLDDCGCPRPALIPTLSHLRHLRVLRPILDRLHAIAKRQLRRLDRRIQSEEFGRWSSQAREAVVGLKPLVETAARALSPSELGKAEDWYLAQIDYVVKRTTGKFHDDAVAELLAAVEIGCKPGTDLYGRHQKVYRGRRRPHAIAEALRGLATELSSTGVGAEEPGAGLPDRPLFITHGDLAIRFMLGQSR